ncbi:uncharacterized protein METZ01_LOCUS380455, partial [marine metagenome]
DSVRRFRIRDRAGHCGFVPERMEHVSTRTGKDDPGGGRQL